MQTLAALHHTLSRSRANILKVVVLQQMLFRVHKLLRYGHSMAPARWPALSIWTQLNHRRYKSDLQFCVPQKAAMQASNAARERRDYRSPMVLHLWYSNLFQEINLILKELLLHFPNQWPDNLCFQRSSCPRIRQDLNVNKTSVIPHGNCNTLFASQ